MRVVAFLYMKPYGHVGLVLDTVLKQPAVEIEFCVVFTFGLSNNVTNLFSTATPDVKR